MKIKGWIYDFKARLMKPEWVRQYKEEMSHETMSSDEILSLNWKKRLSVLKFAYENSPYYQKLYNNSGLEPGDVKTESDWEKVPMLTREALRFHFDEIKINNLKLGTFRLYTTGGSTGEPSKVLKDNNFSSTALNWRANSWAEVGRGENSATIMRTHPGNWKIKLRHFLTWFPSTNIMLDAGNMNDETLERFILEWRKYKPQTVSSYVGGVYELALHCLRNEIKLPPPKAIFTTAAPLPLSVRHTIQNVFHAPVFDNYVGTEAHPMANQCRYLAENNIEALHIHNDYRHLEIVDEGGRLLPNETVGDILVTDLEDRVFPIVRYRMGDRGQLLNKKCECGRPYPLMGAVHGRSFDFIYLENGRIMGECWATAFDKCLFAIHNFQIHQHKDKTVTLSVVMSKEYPDAKKCIQEVASELQNQLGSIPLTVEYKDYIPHNRGKIKYIISDVENQ